MKLDGRAFKFGDNIDTDVIIPARYLVSYDEAELARHCMEPARPEFYKILKKDDIIVAGKNFGCGSSREHAPLSIKGLKAGCVIAKSFARIFFRNAINIGLPLVELPGDVDKIAENDVLRVDFSRGEVFNVTKNQKYKFNKYPGFLQEIMARGGLIKWLKAKKSIR